MPSRVLLRSLEAKKLVLYGIATSGVVLSTLRQAADLDYELVVLADGDTEVPPQEDLITVDELTASLT